MSDANIVQGVIDFNPYRRMINGLRKSGFEGNADQLRALVKFSAAAEGVLNGVPGALEKLHQRLLELPLTDRNRLG